MEFSEDPKTDVLLLKLKLTEVLSQLGVIFETLISSDPRTLGKLCSWEDINGTMPGLISNLQLIWDAANKLSLNQLSPFTQAHLHEGNPSRKLFEYSWPAAFEMESDNGKPFSLIDEAITASSARTAQYIAPIVMSLSNNQGIPLPSANRNMERQQSLDELFFPIPLPVAQFNSSGIELGVTSSDLRVPFGTEQSSATFEENPATPSHLQNGTSTKTCDVCFKTFTRGTTLREHARVHTNEKPYKCGTCEKPFSRLKDFRRHELLHANTKKFHCGTRAWNAKGSGCGSGFTRKDALREHLKSVKGRACLKSAFDLFKYQLKLEPEPMFQCKGKLCDVEHDFDLNWGCGSIFLGLDGLREHLRSRWSSDECLRGLSESSKQRVMSSSYKFHRRLYSCMKTAHGCGCDFENRNDLWAHLDVPFESSCLRLWIISDALEDAVKYSRKCKGS